MFIADQNIKLIRIKGKGFMSQYETFTKEILDYHISNNFALLRAACGDYYGYMDYGQFLYEKQNYSAAYPYLFVAAKGAIPNAYYLLARTCLYLSYFEEALEYSILSRARKDPDANLAVGYSFLSLGEQEKGIAALKEELTIGTNSGKSEALQYLKCNFHINARKPILESAKFFLEKNPITHSFYVKHASEQCVEHPCKYAYDPDLCKITSSQLHISDHEVETLPLLTISMTKQKRMNGLLQRYRDGEQTHLILDALYYLHGLSLEDGVFVKKDAFLTLPDLNNLESILSGSVSLQKAVS